MMHDLVYLGNGQYRCVDCGKGTDKAGVGEFQETACEAKDDFVAMNKKLARLDKEVAEVEKLYQANDERMINLEKRLAAVEPPGK